MSSYLGLLYTPDREHFGIVPLESMQMGLPVIAVNSGGPTETIAHKETGFLCKQVSNFLLWRKDVQFFTCMQ